MVILEAMSREVPVAASAICAVPEMLDFGRAGYVVEPVSVTGWRDQLARILADPPRCRNSAGAALSGCERTTRWRR